MFSTKIKHAFLYYYYASNMHVRNYPISGLASFTCHSDGESLVVLGDSTTVVCVTENFVATQLFPPEIGSICFVYILLKKKNVLSIRR